MLMLKPNEIWGLYYLSIVVLSYKACICMVTYIYGGEDEREIGLRGWEMGARCYVYIYMCELHVICMRQCIVMNSNEKMQGFQNEADHCI